MLDCIFILKDGNDKRNVKIFSSFVFRKKFEGRREVWEAPNMMDIGTRRIFNEEHDMFRQSVRRFFQEEVAPQHDQ